MSQREYVRQVGRLTWVVRNVIRQFRKRILGRGISVTLPTGLAYYAPPWDRSGTEVYVTGAHIDWGSEYLMFSEISADGVFVDVGAHTGYYSLYMLPKVSSVFAFEPDPKSYEVLTQYQSRHQNFHCIQQALSNRSEVVGVRSNGRGYTYLMETSANGKSHKGVPAAQIKVAKLDEYVEYFESAVVGIKIDVDGPDLDVLEGARDTIARFSPIVLMELDSREYSRLFSICHNMKYLVYAFVKSTDDPRHPIFVRLSERIATQSRLKMLFLVPKEKKEEFDRYCSG